MRNNKKVYFSRKDFVLLYAYMRQIDLSVHRSRWTSWNELTKYYEDKLSPKEVIDLFCVSILKKNAFNFYEIPNKKTFFVKLKCVTSRLIWNHYYLTVQELETCCYLLDQFVQLLQNKNIDTATKNYDSKKIERFRAKVASFYNLILEPKLSSRDVNKAMLVEHYLQNESLRTLTLEEIVADYD